MQSMLIEYRHVATVLLSEALINLIASWTRVGMSIGRALAMRPSKCHMCPQQGQLLNHQVAMRRSMIMLLRQALSLVSAVLGLSS